MKRLVVVDTSNVLYRFCSAKQGDPLHGMHYMLEVLQGRFPTHEIVFALDGYDAARRKLFPAYKDNRHKTAIQKDLKQKVANTSEQFIKHIPHFGAHWAKVGNIEADDLAALIPRGYQFGAKPAEVPESVVLLSKDTDWVQIVLANPNNTQLIKHEDETLMNAGQLATLHGVCGPQAFAEKKAMIGDSSDNIAGWPGIADGGADKIFDALMEAGGRRLQDLRFKEIYNEVFRLLQGQPRAGKLIEFIEVYTSGKEDPRLENLKVFYAIIGLNPTNIAKRADPLMQTYVGPVEGDLGTSRQIIREFNIPRRRPL